MVIKETRADRIFNVVIYIVLALFTLICLYPMYLVLISSFSDPASVAAGDVLLVPKGFSFAAYTAAFENGDILLGYRNSLFYTVVGVALNMLLTIPCAYVLSKPDFAGGSFIMKMLVFTMYFSGGLVPQFILLRSLRLLNSWWVVIFQGGLNVTNLIIARSFFSSGVPRELEEAAMIDGCSAVQTFTRIVLPLSKAMLSVILLYYAVARWNNYTSALYFLPKAPEKYPLQMVLRKMLLTMQQLAMYDSDKMELYANLYNQIKYSVIVIASAPLLIVYPFIQKYFEKGVMLGSVKG